MIPMMQREVILLREWITQSQFIDIVGISEMTPGVIAVNIATFVGYKVSGTIAGGILATLGVILPSSIIVYLISHYFEKFKNSVHIDSALKFIRPAVLGLIAAAAFLLMKDAFADKSSIGIALLTFYLSAFRKINPIFILMAMGVLGLIIY